MSVPMQSLLKSLSSLKGTGLKADPDTVVFAHLFFCLFIVKPASYLHFIDGNVRIHLRQLNHLREKETEGEQ